MKLYESRKFLYFIVLVLSLNMPNWTVNTLHFILWLVLFASIRNRTHAFIHWFKPSSGRVANCLFLFCLFSLTKCDKDNLDGLILFYLLFFAFPLSVSGLFRIKKGGARVQPDEIKSEEKKKLSLRINGWNADTNLINIGASRLATCATIVCSISAWQLERRKKEKPKKKKNNSKIETKKVSYWACAVHTNLCVFSFCKKAILWKRSTKEWSERTKKK